MIPTKETESATAADWDRIHGQVQTILDSMVEGVRKKVAKLASTGNRTPATKICPLLTYREFSWAEEPDLEAIIVAVRFHFSNRCLMAQGDIGGEETGCTYFETDEKPVADNPSAVLGAATEIAKRLSQQSVIVINALLERRSSP